MAWLLRKGEVLASLEVARTRKERRTGLLGRNELEGALLIERTRWVHTIAMKFPLDVAFMDADGNVIKIATMKQHRVAMPVMAARSVLEAEAGAFVRWGLRVGDHLEQRE
jgi:uncharacterized protein